MRAFVLAVLLVGCAPAQHLDEPTAIVWEETFRAKCTAPTMEILYDATCYERVNSFEYTNNCYSGLYLPATHHVIIAWRGSYSSSAFAHELLHGWQACRGIFDYNHENDEWKFFVPYANSNLIARGY